jgi:hypothetical protein
MPRREAWIELPSQAYPGFEVRLFVNYPRHLQDRLRSGDHEQMRSALCEIVTGTRYRGPEGQLDYWPDFDGGPLPPPTTAEFWDSIPDELAACVLALLSQEASRLPESLLRARRTN